jgi:hypothetical protein
LPQAACELAMIRPRGKSEGVGDCRAGRRDRDEVNVDNIHVDHGVDLKGQLVPAPHSLGMSGNFCGAPGHRGEAKTSIGDLSRPMPSYRVPVLRAGTPRYADTILGFVSGIVSADTTGFLGLSEDYRIGYRIGLGAVSGRSFRIGWPIRHLSELSEREVSVIRIIAPSPSPCVRPQSLRGFG